MNTKTSPPPSQELDEKNSYTLFDIGEMSFDDMRKLWKKGRKAFFLALKRERSLSNYKIGQMFDLSRQQVGNIVNDTITTLKPEKVEES